MVASKVFVVKLHFKSTYLRYLLQVSTKYQQSRLKASSAVNLFQQKYKGEIKSPQGGKRNETTHPNVFESAALLE